MKKTKILTFGMSVLGAAAICGGSVFAMTSCGTAKDKSDIAKIDIGDDDFVLTQAETRVEQLTEMIFHSDNSRILPLLSNGVKLSDAKADTGVVLQMFSGFRSILDEVINRDDAPTDKDIADILQASFQILPVTSRTIFGLFANSLMIRYLVGEDGSQTMVNWFDSILDNSIRLKTWAKDSLHLNELLFEGVLEKLLAFLPNPKEAVWSLVTGFYGNPWYLGIDHNHVDGDVNTNHAINISQLPYFSTPTYTKYDWSQVRPGDLMYSANGFAFGDYSTGHMGIIKGWQVSDDIKYLQVVEPDQYGEAYCAIDDSRIDSDALSILRINNASDLQAKQAAAFADGQVEANKDYYIPLIPTMSENYNTNSWYCSELCWASYKSLGFDIQNYNYLDGMIPCEPGVSPHNIYNYENVQVLIQNEAGKI